MRQGKTRWILALLVVLGTMAPDAALAGWWDDLEKGQAVELPDVIRAPSRYEDRILSFFCIYHRKDDVFAPLAAPYHPQRYENIAVWPDGTPLWEKKSYERDYPFLYIDRANPQHADLLRLEPFTRIEITGRVRGLIRARPCIEIRSFRPTGHRLGRAVVQSVMSGDRHTEEGRLQLALDNYQRALAPDLPPTYVLLVRQRVAEALTRMGRPDEARRVAGGEILGGSHAPEPGSRTPASTLGDPFPNEDGGTATPAGPPAGAAGPSPLTRDLPGESVGPGPVARDLPGEPVGASPEAPSLPPVSPSAPSSPGRSPISRDLPGTPAGPSPISRDLPGTPAGPSPIARDLPGTEAGPPPPPIVGPEDVRPEPPPRSTTPRTTPRAAAPPRRAARPTPPYVPAGPPRRLPPRLAGVK